MRLFRAIPRAPLTTHVELIRPGRRIVSVLAANSGAPLEVTRGQVMFLSLTEGTTTYPIAAPPGRDGLETLLATPMAELSGGFHTLFETRWPEISKIEKGAQMWVCVPFPIFECETPTPSQRLTCISDAGNALANYAANWVNTEEHRNASFINTDISVHLLHPPQG